MLNKLFVSIGVMVIATQVIASERAEDKLKSERCTAALNVLEEKVQAWLQDEKSYAHNTQVPLVKPLLTQLRKGIETSDHQTIETAVHKLDELSSNVWEYAHDKYGPGTEFESRDDMISVVRVVENALTVEQRCGLKILATRDIPRK